MLSLSYLANFGQFFRLQKVHATCIAEVDEKNWGPELILTPSKRVFFKGGDTFPELSSPTHQLGLKPPYDKRGFSKIEGSPSILKKLADKEGASDKETIRNYFSKIEGRPSILKKMTLLKVKVMLLKMVNRKD